MHVRNDGKWQEPKSYLTVAAVTLEALSGSSVHIGTQVVMPHHSECWRGQHYLHASEEQASATLQKQLHYHYRWHYLIASSKFI
jgi:hypothetical protein